MHLQKAADEALDSAVRKVSSMGHSTKEALERLLDPNKDAMVYIVLLDAVRSFRSTIEDNVEDPREHMRGFLLTMSNQAVSWLRALTAPD